MGIITKFTVNLEHEIGENSSNCLRYCPHCLPDEYTSWYPQRNVELFSWASLSMSPFAFSGLQTNYFSDTLHTYVLIHLVLDLYYACIYIFPICHFFQRSRMVLARAAIWLNLGFFIYFCPPKISCLYTGTKSIYVILLLVYSSSSCIFLVSTVST